MLKKQVNPLIFWAFVVLAIGGWNCKEDTDTPVPVPSFYRESLAVDGRVCSNCYAIAPMPTVRIKFSDAIDPATVANSVFLRENGSAVVALTWSLDDDDSTLVFSPQTPLALMTRYAFDIYTDLKSAHGALLQSSVKATFITEMDTTDKFPRLAPSVLLDSVQARTLRYFWDFGHPVSGMARERNSSGDLVTTGGTGFGIMGILAGVERGFISRQAASERVLTIANFLKNKAQRYHGVFAHWLNGATGSTIAFSSNDNGADLVETAFLMQGLICAREYFDANTLQETELRTVINGLWDEVEWNWFTKGGEEVLYWHWSPDKGWAMNHQIRGWNEALMVYVLAASSRTDSIAPSVYHKGWAQSGNIRNGASYYGIKQPLGGYLGGPLFFTHYSFLGINPNGLSDVYANYEEQNKAHSRINYAYCVSNPRQYFGYGTNCWGLTASDNQNGYSAHSPSNDLGVISPTAALSSFPYTPVESMAALEFFYYKLGDKIWKQYGFTDAFNLSQIWFANSFLAIDQAPILVMIENHRSGLLWDLFMNSPEVQNGMKRLGFDSPYW